MSGPPRRPPISARDIMRQIEKAVLLQTLDHLWREHLVTLEHLRQVIGLRGYGQRDPLNEYKSESFTLFEHMLAKLREAVTGQLMHVQLARQDEVPPLDATELPAHGGPSSRSPHRGGRVRAGRGQWPAAMAGAPSPARARKADRVEPGRSLQLGQGAAERALPLRLRQEIQALPRHVRLAGALSAFAGEGRRAAALDRPAPPSSTVPALDHVAAAAHADHRRDVVLLEGVVAGL